MNILITGGCGFIGSALIRELINNTDHTVVNIDKLTYAANLQNLTGYDKNTKYVFVEGDICNTNLVKEVLNQYQPQGVIHLAAESHVDRSIKNAHDFIQTNILGTFTLLEQTLQICGDKEDFLFHHVSTDEVFGDLNKDDSPFKEDNNYSPSSPYSASKAASDHLVRAWGRTYGLPFVVSNCSNNYGPFQSPDKLIPLMITNALNNRDLPIYGDGTQIRDWLFVEDHVDAILKIFNSRKYGETFNIGGNAEKTNLDVVKTICLLLDELISPEKRKITFHEELIRFVEDRPGHDTRYAIDSSKIHNILNWTPKESFDSGIKKTILWYLENKNMFNSNFYEITNHRGL